MKMLASNWFCFRIHTYMHRYKDTYIHTCLYIFIIMMIVAQFKTSLLEKPSKSEGCRFREIPKPSFSYSYIYIYIYSLLLVWLVGLHMKMQRVEITNVHFHIYICIYLLEQSRTYSGAGSYDCYMLCSAQKTCGRKPFCFPHCLHVLQHCNQKGNRASRL